MVKLKDSQQEKQDIKVYIGDHYHSFLNENHRIKRWNFFGLVFGMFWLAYRKRYLIVGIFILIDILVSLLFRNHLFYWLVFAALMHLYIGRSGNLLYLAGTKKHVEQIRRRHPHLDEKEMKRLLIKKGRTSWCFILPLLIYFVLIHTYVFIDDIKIIVASYF
ncbi:DUF2628 domain-containing protein [Bacillus sp. D386]|uniref:DUF2628 domain-containing protein n=1 Tax=Bacillus sp. D386 TaxID=2587155 RepID=UPI00111CE629|nr:DUF2628 domain-containing protein [Bacillus sp. D386]